MWEAVEKLGTWKRCRLSPWFRSCPRPRISLCLFFTLYRYTLKNEGSRRRALKVRHGQRLELQPLHSPWCLSQVVLPFACLFRLCFSTLFAALHLPTRARFVMLLATTLLALFLVLPCGRRTRARCSLCCSLFFSCEKNRSRRRSSKDGPVEELTTALACVRVSSNNCIVTITKQSGTS